MSILIEIATIEINKNDLAILHDLGISYNLKLVDVKDFDYSNDKIWLELRKASTKAYKEQKEREFKLRHNGRN